jgi:16S rRNA A1518/A1519 N6-dimethyltransferase RsmA/KsgA/DIM1 with predicted DNA glycosylase/AP lyase activity
VAARTRGASLPPAGGQHFLRSARLADEIVAAAGVRPDELVVEIGAGFGRLTAPLLSAGARVVAVELDPGLSASLRRRYGGPRLTVVEGDVLATARPDELHRVLGNLPFAITTPILRRFLDDPATPLERAELIVQDGFARKRASARPTTLLALGWLPWWRLTAERHLPAACFDPPPAVDAALLSVRRRQPALLDPGDAPAFRAFLRAGFTHDARPVRRTVALAPRGWKHLARDRGLPIDARPHQLDVWDWVALFRMAESRPCARS